MTRISGNVNDVSNARQAARQAERAANQELGGAKVSFHGGHLNIRGTKGDDEIDVKQLDANTVSVTVNGEERTFEGVKSVKVNGGKGNDLINAEKAPEDTFDRAPTKKSALKVNLAGNRGDDEINSSFDYAKLLGGHGQDDLFSSGSDATLRGGNGDDVLEDKGIRADVRGGNGADLILGEGLGARIRGGAGNDRVLNDDAAARIRGGGGDDVVQDDTGTADVRNAALVDEL